MIVITALALAFLAVMLVLPNYIAIRYGVFGGNANFAVAAGPGAEAPVPGSSGSAQPETRTPSQTSPKRASGSRLAGLTQRGYLWKALSPLVFSVAFIIGIAVGGVVGYTLLGLAFLNLVWGFTGWGAYRPGKRR